MTTIVKIRSSFNDPALLDQALTHRSWVNEHPGVRDKNERLEFLGDAILEFIVSEVLYKTFPEKEEGYLKMYHFVAVSRILSSTNSLN